jgi:hypothetical protein
VHGVMRLDQEQALAVARELVGLGMPMFLAPFEDGEYKLPLRWQSITADPMVVDNWRPGMALCAVTGHVLDLIDIDPRSGGVVPEGHLPPVYASAATPSGGMHHFVLPLGVRSRDGVWPGVDVKSGRPDGSGRGFAFIAPTVRLSKMDGTPQTYTWKRNPVAAQIRQGAISQHSAEVARLRQHIAELRAPSTPDGLPRRIPHSVARSEWDRAYGRLVDDVRHWAATGWGGAAHAGLLAHTTHLARLSPEAAPAAFEAAFAAAGVVPDPDDLAKLDSAIGAAVPDVVVPDADMPPQELFWAGASVPGTEVDRGGGAPGPRVAGPEYARAGGFRFLDENELDRIPSPDPLVDGLLWQASVARLFGPSTVGKTWVVLDVAAHVANGMTWQGREVAQTKALYVAAEGAPTIGPRLGYWRDFHGRKTGLQIWPEPVTIGGPHWEEFVLACVSAELGLVILDTQAAMTVGRKEDSNDDAAEVLRCLTNLAMVTGACVLSVHHNGWAEEGRARGASGMFGGLDTELQLTEGRGEREVALHQRKQRYAERGKPMRLRLAPHAGGLVVLGGGEPREGGFFGDNNTVRAQAIYEHLLTWEAAGGAVPPKMAMRTMRQLVRDELNETGKQEAIDEAIRMFKRAKGLPVGAGSPEDN